MRLLLIALGALLCTLDVAGQTTTPATFVPTAPTDRDVIQATFTVPFPCIIISQPRLISGSVIRENVLLSCSTGPAPGFVNETVTFGPLPPGTYTYEIYFDRQDGDPPQLRSTQTLVVTGAPAVPTLSAPTLAGLAVLLAVVALALMRR